jgi:uncharacterized protein CbrC (UPF0167 family)
MATGAIVPSETVCACCDQARGYIYCGPVYGETELDDCICPWCIADGSAATKLGASFADSYPLIKAGIAREIAEEINLRTPSYVCWQQEEWLSHCNDACEFHGDASAADIRGASVETKEAWLAHYMQDEKGWVWATDSYAPGGGSALYKFVCRHCGLVLLGWDLD